jgi:hypothetical protein
MGMDVQPDLTRNSLDAAPSRRKRPHASNRRWLRGRLGDLFGDQPLAQLEQQAREATCVRTSRRLASRLEPGEARIAAERAWAPTTTGAGISSTCWRITAARPPIGGPLLRASPCWGVLPENGHDTAGRRRRAGEGLRGPLPHLGQPAAPEAVRRGSSWSRGTARERRPVHGELATPLPRHNRARRLRSLSAAEPGVARRPALLRILLRGSVPLYRVRHAFQRKIYTVTGVLVAGSVSGRPRWNILLLVFQSTRSRSAWLGSTSSTICTCSLMP